MRVSAADHSRDKKRLTEGNDPELWLAYYLFHAHHWEPSRYYGKPYGEKELIRAFSSYEIEQRNDYLDGNPRLASILI